MVVPTVGIIPNDDNRRVVPIARLLDGIDCFCEEGLFSERIRILGMAVLIDRRLHVTDRGQGVVGQRRVEIRDIVLVVGLVGLANHFHRARPQMVRVARARIFHERSNAGAVVVLEHMYVRTGVNARVLHAISDAVDLRLMGDMLGATNRRRIHITVCIELRGCGGQEATLKIAPGHVLFVQKIADILPGHFKRPALAAIVEIAGEIGVGQGYRLIHRIDVEAAGVRVGGIVGIVNDDSMRVPRDNIGVARYSGAIGSGKRIVAHGVVLGIVPQCLDGVAVVIIHDGRAVRGAAGALAAGRLREAIHRPTVVRLLLGFVVMSHIAGVGVGGAKPRRIGSASEQAPIRVVLQQGRRQHIGCRRAWARHEFRRRHASPALLAGNIRRVWISPEEIVESSVLGNDDHNVLDRCARILAMVVPITIIGVNDKG